MGTRYNRLNGGRAGVLITRVCYRDGKTFFQSYTYHTYILGI